MVLVTGSAGFIGYYLIEKLLQRNFIVRGIDIQNYNIIHNDYEHIEGNILSQETIHYAMRNIDTIIHLAAEHKDFGVSEEDYYRVNVEGTKILLDEATKNNVKKFIFFSSVAVYGSKSNTNEEIEPEPNNPYGRSKLLAEQEVKKWSEKDKERVAIIIRPTVVFGPNSKANIFRLIKQICSGKFVMIGNGNNIKSIAYIRNLVEATIFLMERCTSGLHVYNYSDTPHYTTRELVNIIAKLAGKKEYKYHVPLPIALSCGILFDFLGKISGIDFPITAARMKKFAMPTCHYSEKIRNCGFVPPYSIEEGLRENILWYKYHVAHRIQN